MIPRYRGILILIVILLVSTSVKFLISVDRQMGEIYLCVRVYVSISVVIRKSFRAWSDNRERCLLGGLYRR